MDNRKAVKTISAVCILLSLAAFALLAWTIADDNAPGWVLRCALACVALGSLSNIIRIFKK